MLKARVIALIIVLTLLVSVAGVFAQDQTIVDVAAGNPDFSTLVGLVQSAGLADVLASDGPFTVFAPTNEAFAKLPQSVVDLLGSDPELLTHVLTYHVVSGKVTAADATTMMAPSMEMGSVGGEPVGSELDVKVGDDGVTVNGAAVVSADIEASNGVIHAIDTVLIPSVTLPEVDSLSVTGNIITAGSSTVFPLSEAVAKSFTDAGYADQITIDSIGTGGGFQRFCESGETDIANASRRINEKELANCAALANPRIPVEFRVGTDALAVVVSGDSAVAALTYEQLALAFSDPRDEAGNVTSQRTWQDINPDWPADPIQRFIPGTDSGTFDYFVEAIFEPIYAAQKESGTPADPFIAKDFEVAEGTSNRDAAKVAILTAAHQASEDDNVLVQGIEGSANGIGFFGYAYYQNEGSALKALSIAKAADGEPVAPNADSVDKNQYPLARPLFIYSDAQIMAEKPQVAAFINYYLTNVNDLIGPVGYFPANPAALNMAKLNFLAATHVGEM
jgi:phosphate binding protein